MTDCYPRLLFHDLILKNVEDFGSTPALVQDDQTITFEQIPDIVSRVAMKLVDLGVVKGDVILVSMKNSIWYPLLFLACAKIGAILSGTNPDSTYYELKHCLLESDAKIVFTSEKVLQENQWMKTEVQIELLPTDIIQYVSRLEFVPDNMFNAEKIKLNIDDILLGPFSSGTTGDQKCCLLTHRNFLASTFALKSFLFDELLANSNRKTIAFLPFYHASGFWALLLCLLEGCTTYIMADFHPIVMMDLIEKHSIDTINIVPAIASSFLKIGYLQGRCPTLRNVLCGSSGFPKVKCIQFLSLFPQVTNFIQGYGMTELVVLSHVTQYNTNLQNLGSCGKLVPGFEVKYIVNEDGQQELLLKSDAIMKFYKNGKANLDEDGFLHTGDIVEEKNGFFYIVDRKKDLIKVNGFQVSPTEIENIIYSFPKVIDVAVVGIDDELCGQIPRAFIVLEEETDEYLFLKHLNHILKEKLTAVKQLRGGVHIVKQLPKSASGKIQKNKLRNY